MTAPNLTRAEARLRAAQLQVDAYEQRRTVLERHDELSHALRNRAADR